MQSPRCVSLSVIRKLDALTDEELETGDFSLSRKSQEVQSYYLAYLVLAEIQEGLITGSFA